MKIKIVDKKKLLIGVCILLFLLVLSNTLARQETTTEKKPGIASQFLTSLKCILTECGWPAIVILILPAIAIYIYKKIFSWG